MAPATAPRIFPRLNLRLGPGIAAVLKEPLGAPFEKFFNRGGLLHNQTVIHEQRLSAPPALGIQTDDLLVGYAGTRRVFFIRTQTPGPKGCRETLKRHRSVMGQLEPAGQSLRHRKLT